MKHISDEFDAAYFLRLANTLPEDPPDPDPTADEIALEKRKIREGRVRELTGSRSWPARAVEAALDPRQTHGVTQLAGWDTKAHNVCVLSGPPGTGKTVAAANWALCNSGSMEFLRASTFAASSRYDDEFRTSVYGARALCLDDLGAEYLDGKGSFLVDLDELVDTYYGNRRPLIVTTNLDSTAFKKRYGRRVEDRIRECATWMVVSGDSMRKAAP